MKPLLPPSAVDPIFRPLLGKRVGLVHSPRTGNCGDRMIERSAEQLLREFGVRYAVQEPEEPTPVDVLLLFGGGNYGHPLCPEEARRRAAAVLTGRPCVLLPQTVYGHEWTGHLYRAVYVRDHVSQRLLYGSVLMPDLALCYRTGLPGVPPARHDRGEFFTTSPEGLHRGRGEDPRHRFTDPDNYLRYVGEFRSVHTDCLHAAVCGLACGRAVTLYPTRLHKQRSVWESWLKGLGCVWSDECPK